jgi:surfeit locus 1 family protein
MTYRLIPLRAARGYATLQRPEKPQSRYAPSTLILGLIPIFTFGLGVWQVKRLQWKVALIDDLEAKLSRDEMALPRRIKFAFLLELPPPIDTNW